MILRPLHICLLMSMYLGSCWSWIWLFNFCICLFLIWQEQIRSQDMRRFSKDKSVQLPFLLQCHQQSRLSSSSSSSLGVIINREENWNTQNTWQQVSTLVVGWLDKLPALDHEIIFIIVVIVIFTVLIITIIVTLIVITIIKRLHWLLWLPAFGEERRKQFWLQAIAQVSWGLYLQLSLCSGLGCAKSRFPIVIFTKQSPNFVSVAEIKSLKNLGICGLDPLPIE